MYTILAVDDEPFNLDLIEATFSLDKSVKIHFAENATDAIHLLEEHKIDVVLLDISMPVIDGLQALEMMRLTYQALPIIMVTANHDKEHEALELGASDFITKPYSIDELRIRTINYAKMYQYHKQIHNQKEHLENEVSKRTEELRNALKLAEDTEQEIATRLGRAAEYRDMETGGHIRRMARYSELLANLYGLDEEKCKLIFNAAPLHDVGKVAIPDKILLKPGRFDEDEFAIMKTHAQLGAEILSDVEKFPILEAARIIALEHHEKYDGTGYPNQKKGEDIDLYARIVAIADVFDALNSKRVYKEAMDLETVLKIMKDGSGTHFDPNLITIFLDNLDKFLAVQKQYPE